MKEYHKIQSIFKRDKRTHKFIVGEWSVPEFDYLRNNNWIFTEKVDGTNIRVIWDCIDKKIGFGGKTDNASIPTFLIAKLQDLFTIEKFEWLYPEISLCLYGEGYGAKIQKGGGNYISDGVDFVLFDILVDKWWLQREDIEDVANKLCLKCVPIVNEGTIAYAIDIVKAGYESSWGNFMAEGLVIKPELELFSRNGHRIISKLKIKDF